MIHRAALVKVVGITLVLAGCGGGSRRADTAASPQAASDCTREIPVAVVPTALHQMKWSDGTGHGEGDDPQAVFTAPPSGRMCGIRLRFTLETGDGQPAVFQVFWAKPGAIFSEAEGSWGTILESSPRERTILVRDCWPPSMRCLPGEIDRIRIDPATEAVDFKLAEVTVLVR